MHTEKHLPNQLVVLKEYFAEINSCEVLSTFKDDIFLLEINGKKYVLKIYSSEIDRARIDFFEDLQNFASEKLRIEPKVLKTLSGKYNILLGGNVWEISSYEENTEFNKEILPATTVFYEMGLFLGRLHQAFDVYQEQNEEIPPSVLLHFPDSPKHLLELLSKYQNNQISEEWVDILKGKIEIVTNTSKRNSFQNLPIKIVHGDFYSKNLLFNRKMDIVGLIDYAQAGLYYRCYEVIRAVIQTNKYLGNVELKAEYLKMFLTGYSKNINLTADELDQMLNLYIFTQASDISFNDLNTVNGADESLKDYSKYRYESLVSLFKNSDILNQTINGKSWKTAD